MVVIFLVAISLMTLTALGRVLEASRRHAVCVRFEHDLRASLDEPARRPGQGAWR